MRAFTLVQIVAAIIAFVIAAPVCAQAKGVQPFAAIDTAGIGAGAVYSLNNGDEVQFDGTFFGGGYNSSTVYGISANGANPVVLNLSLKNHISTGKLALTYNRYLHKTKPFFVSAGIVNNLFKIDADTVSTDSTLVFSGTTYSAAALGTLDIHARWNIIDSYIGLGWAHHDADGRERGPRIELGLYNLGTPNISFTTSGVVAANPAIFGPYLDSLRAREQHDLGGVTIYPVLHVSVPIGGPLR